MSKKHRFGAWLQLVLAALIIIAPLFLTPVCASMVELASGKMAPMRCHYLKMAAIGTGGLLVATGLLRLFAKKEAEQMLKLVQFAGAILTILWPTVLIGACATKTMACRMGTFPALVVLGSVSAACALVDYLIGRVRR